MSSAYLKIAELAILQVRKPLTPVEMLQIAQEGQFLPNHLAGETMHKTMMARLSEHIRECGSKAQFYRTAPGTFFLTELAKRPETPKQYRTVHRGFLRSKSIRKEDVLVAPRGILENEIYGEFVPFSKQQFYDFFANHCEFVDRAWAEGNDRIKQFVTFTLVFSGKKLLTYRRGKFTTTSETLKGQKTVGFGGHVNDTDFNLFHFGGEALKANAARELREELFLDDFYDNFERTIERTRVLGYVNVDGDFDAEHHIAVLVAFNHAIETLPKKGELSINQLSWIDATDHSIDTSEYDFWSRIIIENLRSGTIVIPEWNDEPEEV